VSDLEIVAANVLLYGLFLLAVVAEFVGLWTMLAWIVEKIEDWRYGGTR